MMKSEDNVGITFVNVLLGRGVLNNVVNLTLGAYNFTPAGDTIDPDPVVCARLRMDVSCLKQMHDAIGTLLEAIEAEQKDPNTAALNGSGVVTGEKPN